MNQREKWAISLAQPRLAEAWLKGPGAKAAGRSTRRQPGAASALGGPMSGSVIVPSAELEARVRWETGVAVYPLKDLAGLPLEEALPMRTPRNHNQALSSPGIMPMTKVDAVLLTESRIERAVALGIDFHGGYSGISAQPFELTLPDGTCHVPDFAVRRSNGNLAIVDVRPRDRRDLPSASKFDLMGVVLGRAALEYHVTGGPSALEDVNVRFLAAFSRQPRLWAECRPTLIQMATAGEVVTWGALRNHLSAAFGLESLWIQPVIGHAVWAGLLSLDLGQQLHDGTQLTWTPAREQAVMR